MQLSGARGRIGVQDSQARSIKLGAAAAKEVEGSKREDLSLSASQLSWMQLMRRSVYTIEPLPFEACASTVPLRVVHVSHLVGGRSVEEFVRVVYGSTGEALAGKQRAKKF